MTGQLRMAAIGVITRDASQLVSEWRQAIEVCDRPLLRPRLLTVKSGHAGFNYPVYGNHFSHEEWLLIFWPDVGRFGTFFAHLIGCKDRAQCADGQCADCGLNAHY